MTIRISFSDKTVRVAVEINGAIESAITELPQRTWVGLTGEELRDIARSFKGNTQRRFAEHWDEIKSFIDEVESKLKGEEHMNERIKELAREAGLLVHNPEGVPTKLEKFAELIVAECVKLCEHESNNDIYDPYDMGMSGQSNNIKEAIKKHFGVES